MNALPKLTQADYKRVYNARQRLARGRATGADLALLATYRARPTRPLIGGPDPEQVKRARKMIDVVGKALGVDVLATNRVGKSGRTNLGAELARATAVVMLRDAKVPVVAIAHVLNRSTQAVFKLLHSARRRPDVMRMVELVVRSTEPKPRAIALAAPGPRPARQVPASLAKTLGRYLGSVLDEATLASIAHDLMSRRPFPPIQPGKRPAPAPAAGEPYTITGVIGDRVWTVLDRWAEAEEIGGPELSRVLRHRQGVE